MSEHVEELWEKLNDHARRAQDCSAGIGYKAHDRKSLETLREIHHTMVQLQEAAATAVELAIREGHSQSKTAEALGVPASTLAGAKKEFLG